jgi:ABC-type sugar transport system substrate-binding protein
MVIREILKFRWLNLLVGSLLLVGCSKHSGPQTSSGEAGQDKIKIGFVVKQPEEPWFQLEWEFAQQAADKDGFELIKIAAPDGEKALGAIDNLAASGARGFVICTPDVKLGPAIVAKAQSYDLKVIAVDDQFIGGDGKPMTDVPYLGSSGITVASATFKSSTAAQAAAAAVPSAPAAIFSDSAIDDSSSLLQQNKDSLQRVSPHRR